ncbi:MAG TPA: GspH/FimT family pseudopilin [Longimicrobium sp.]|nr:GspH/FimT family pseudopilin [Longimicrobium sp.]
MTRTHTERTRRRGGFTLTELMMVVIIIGLMAAMAGPRMMRWVQTIGQRGATNQLAGDLAMARIQAVRQGATVSFRIDDADTYRVTVDDANGNVVRTLRTVNLQQVYRGATLDPASGRIAFDSRGVVRPNPVSTVSQIVLTRGYVRKRVNISGVGRIEVADY